MERKDLAAQMYKERKGALDVDWQQGETPIALPEGLSEGTSLVKMKDGSVGVIRRGSHGTHYGVQVMTAELREALIAKLQE
jgi:hypothetical protein